MQYLLMTDYYFLMLNAMVEFFGSMFSQGVISALIVLILGGIFGIEFGKVARKLCEKIKADKALDAAGLKSFLGKGGVKFSVGSLAEWIVRWFVILFALMVAVDMLALKQVSDFLSEILGYVPNIIGALAILAVALIVAKFISETIKGAAKVAGIGAYNLLAALAKWSIIIIAVLVALEQLGFKTSVLQIFAGGLSMMLALAGGLAFGLGGQGLAREILDEMKKKISRGK